MQAFCSPIPQPNYRRFACPSPHIEGVGEPVEGELSGLGFQCGPRGLTEANDVNAQISHLLDIQKPLVPWPLFGVVAAAEKIVLTIHGTAFAASTWFWRNLPGVHWKTIHGQVDTDRDFTL